MGGRTLNWLAVLVVALGALALFGGSFFTAKFDAVRDRADGGKSGGSAAAQISRAEFELAQLGMTTSALRARVGAPETTSEHVVEGMTIECWLYGAGATTGAYQLCFANDRLRSKIEFSL